MAKMKMQLAPLLWRTPTIASVIGIATLVAAFTVVPESYAQDGEAELTTEIYRVDDIVVNTDNYPFNGFVMPKTDGRLNPDSGGFTGGFGGGGFGGGAGGGGFGGNRGGGVFSVPSQLGGGGGGGGIGMGGALPFANGGSNGFGFLIHIEDLIQTIEDVVEPDSWDGRGGEATITSLRNRLVVSQTSKNHQAIGSFLEKLSSSLRDSFKPVTIKVRWVLASDKQISELTIDNNQVVSRKALDELSDNGGGRGQITCFDGQTVHLAAGRLRSSVSSVIPVVGQNQIETPYRETYVQNDAETWTQIPTFVMAQISSSGAGGASSTGLSGGGMQSRSSVGYQPIKEWVNYGALLQVTPRISKRGDSVLVDLRSILAMPVSQSVAPAKISENITVDKQNFRAQQFMTTVRIPTGKPVLVGGSAVEPATNLDQQVYVVIEAVVGE